MDRRRGLVALLMSVPRPDPHETSKKIQPIKPPTPSFEWFISVVMFLLTECITSCLSLVLRYVYLISTNLPCIFFPISISLVLIAGSSFSDPILSNLG